MYLIFIISDFILGKTPEIALRKHEIPVLALMFIKISKMTLHIYYFSALMASTFKVYFQDHEIYPIVFPFFKY